MGNASAWQVLLRTPMTLVFALLVGAGVLTALFILVDDKSCHPGEPGDRRRCHTLSVPSFAGAVEGRVPVRRMTPAQYNAWVRQENARRQRAIDAHNREVHRVNAHNERLVKDHNRKVEAHNKKVVADYNRRVRAHNERLRREVARLNATSTSRYASHQRSVATLRQTFDHLESAAEQATWAGPTDLVELSESETANSVAALNALLAEVSSDSIEDEHVAALRATAITDELVAVSEDLDARWRGALFSLHPNNPDASRHFCTSARELLSSLLEAAAPDAEVLAADPGCARTPQGSVSRRARVRHCLARLDEADPALEDFIESDLDDVLSLFSEFNAGTHAEAGRFDLAALAAIKMRVEGAIQFVFRVGGLHRT